MFAVVVRESGDKDQINASASIVETRVKPQVMAAQGFVSAIWMTDRSGATLNVLVFDTEEAARAALERARNAPRPPFMRADSVDLYEVQARA